MSRDGECIAGSLFIFFFQAEDGIRDLTVTGVQTCALPISLFGVFFNQGEVCSAGSRILVEQSIYKRFLDAMVEKARTIRLGDRKSTRLNSSHSQISYAVFCLKKKKSNIGYDPITCAAAEHQ